MLNNEQKSQLLQLHASLIKEAVEACHDPSIRAALQENLNQARKNGWGQLADAIDRILDGERQLDNLNISDEEDRIIADAILEGLKNPDSLPTPGNIFDPSQAPAGFAALIQNAPYDENAHHLLSGILRDLKNGSVETAALSESIQRIFHGERHAESLTAHMAPATASLIHAILDELSKS